MEKRVFKGVKLVLQVLGGFSLRFQYTNRPIPREIFIVVYGKI